MFGGSPGDYWLTNQNLLGLDGGHSSNAHSPRLNFPLNDRPDSFLIPVRSTPNDSRLGTTPPAGSARRGVWLYAAALAPEDAVVRAQRDAPGILPRVFAQEGLTQGGDWDWTPEIR
jgi:hypothetical protein